MKHKLIMLLIGSIVHTSVILGQNYPHLSIVKVNAQVSLDASKQYYYYSYKLRNDPSNNGSISVFRVDISRGSNTVAFDTAGLQFADSYIDGSFRRRYAGL